MTTAELLARLETELAGRYRVERELGAGGMATVYLAEDLRHHRNVAIKVLHAELSAVLGPERFLKEIELTASLQHPHILPLFDSGSANGLLYYVMPFVEGETLRARLEREKQLAIADVLRIATEAAVALQYAHERGVIHRDIKPENILLQNGHALVADFGIALAVEYAGGARMTQTGLSLGTPQYMAPEQAMGETRIDGRADVYALGAVTYEMLAGEAPFTGPNAQAIVARVMTESPRALTLQRKSVPAHVEAAVAQALEKLPADRFAAASDFAEALIRPGEPILRGAGPGSRGGRRARWGVLAIGGLAFLATAAAGFLVGDHHRAAQASVAYHQVTFASEAIFNARFAPDGRTVVFDAAREGSVPALYVVRPDYPEARPLGLDDTHLLAVSSRSELALLTHAHYLGTHRLFVGTLARVPLEGGTPREMLDSVREADWSPDGTTLAIIREVGGRDRLEYPIGTLLYDAPGYLSDLRISPDGQQLAFLEHPTRYDDRGSVDVVDRARHRTVLAAGFEAEEGLAWSADGRLVLFSSAHAGPGLQIHEASLRGGARIAIATPGMTTIQDVSRGGRWLATRDSKRHRIRVRPPGGGDEMDLSWLDSSIFPKLSRDGRLLGLEDVGEAAGADYGAIVRKTDGSPAVRLGEGSVEGFSPDGRSVVALVPTTPAQLRLYPVGVGGTRRLDLGAFSALDHAQVWGPGEDSILACGTISSRTPQCFFRTASDTKWRALTSGGVDAGLASPDGQRVLTVSASGRARLHDLRDGSSRLVSGLRARDRLIRWSPDGESIWVWRADTLPIPVNRVDITTGHRERLETLVPRADPGMLQIFAVTLADDPRVYAYDALQYTSQLFVIEGAR